MKNISVTGFELSGLEPPGCPTPGACSCNCDEQIEVLQKQLAASQAYGQQLRKALEFLVENEASFGYSRPYDEARKCLAIPQDNSALQQVCGEAIAAEREACAKLCEEIGKDIVSPEECAAAIRSRSNQGEVK